MRVLFDWRYAPDVTAPPLMSVWFYPEEDDFSPFQLYIPGDTGAEVSVPPGRYHLVSHPAESEVIRCTAASQPNNHSLHTRAASATEVLFGASSAPANLILEPETTWVASAAEVDIAETGLTYMCVTFSEDMQQNFTPTESKEHTITLYPSDPMCYYTLEVRNLVFDTAPAAISGALTSLSRGLYPATLERHTNAASIAFRCLASEPDNFTASFITFGYHPDEPEANMLHLYIKSAGGKLYIINDPDGTKLDLTSQVHNASDPHHVHLIVDFNGQEVKLGNEVQGALGVTGSEYNEINEEIII